MKELMITIKGGIIVLIVLLGITSCTSHSKRQRLQRDSGRINYTSSPNDHYRNDSRRNSNTEVQYSPPQNNQVQHGASLSDLYEACKPAVFLIYTSDGYSTCQGTGFFISSTGVAVSNYHVFEGTWKGLEEVTLASGEVLKIDEVYESSKENDYIIFKVRSQKSRPYLPIAKQRPKVGEDTFAIGNPQGLTHTLSKGIVSGYREEENYIQMTTEITHGSSGGPLFNMRGEVVGITSAGLGEANINFAIDIQVLRLYRYL